MGFPSRLNQSLPCLDRRALESCILSRLKPSSRGIAQNYACTLSPTNKWKQQATYQSPALFAPVLHVSGTQALPRFWFYCFLGANSAVSYICTTLTAFVNKQEGDPEGKVSWNLPMKTSAFLFFTTHSSAHGGTTLKRKIRFFSEQLISEGNK